MRKGLKFQHSNIYHVYKTHFINQTYTMYTGHIFTPGEMILLFAAGNSLNSASTWCSAIRVASIMGTHIFGQYGEVQCFNPPIKPTYLANMGGGGGTHIFGQYGEVPPVHLTQVPKAILSHYHSTGTPGGTTDTVMSVLSHSDYAIIPFFIIIRTHNGVCSIPLRLCDHSILHHYIFIILKPYIPLSFTILLKTITNSFSNVAFLLYKSNISTIRVYIRVPVCIRVHISALCLLLDFRSIFLQNSPLQVYSGVPFCPPPPVPDI